MNQNCFLNIFCLICNDNVFIYLGWISEETAKSDDWSISGHNESFFRVIYKCHITTTGNKCSETPF